MVTGPVGLDGLVAATPEDRDRVVDFLRAASILAALLLAVRRPLGRLVGVGAASQPGGGGSDADRRLAPGPLPG